MSKSKGIDAGSFLLIFFCTGACLYLLDWPFWSWPLVPGAAWLTNYVAGGKLRREIEDARTATALLKAHNEGARAVAAVGDRPEELKREGDCQRPGGLRPPVRQPLWNLGATLRTQHGFVGAVDAVYVDYWAALSSNVISAGWFDAQSSRPATKDQVWYSLVALDGESAVLVGELDAKEA